MRIGNSVPVAAPPEAVFALLNDVRRVASCMPGASLDGQDGDAWRGRVTVRVGPVAAAYGGTVRFLESDAGQGRLRLQARGADAHGRGNAEAEVVLTVTGDPAGSRLDVATDLVISGKLAQFGKGALDAVSQRLLQRFATNLGELLAAERTGDAGATEPAGADAGATATGGPAAAATATDGSPTAVPGAPAAAQSPAHPAAAAPVPGVPSPLPSGAARYGPLVAAFAFGVFEGWLLTRFGQLRREVAATRRG
ncbi:SRPBCC family protein [Streptomyces catenulae]|uniref:SRPBCC family protein n=1 Tax=Streptomyces catenulae TaxID=66875 RepID=A0ABV2Z4P1_9ACTN|nr:SRPBCC family protein [Streptomyces catenulae]